jgi:hypothetical protein
MASGDTLLIGVDGGATEVKAHAVSFDSLSRPTSFALRPESASQVYTRLSDFAPVPLKEQLAQRDAGRIRLSASETEQGKLWVDAASRAILQVAQQADARRVLVGVGMPGLKTLHGRGICVMNHGPRIPDYLDALEHKLAVGGIELVSPIAALGSDADYCGLGEEYAAEGLFRDVENAYYVGGGTGIADALKLRGRLVPFDQAQSWIMKAWQIPSALGPTFEKLVSAKSLNRVYWDLCGGTKARRHEDTKEPRHKGTQQSEPEAQARALRSNAGVAADVSSAVSPTSPGRYPETDAANGDPLAVAWMDTAALVLAELIFERLWTIRNGRADAPHRGKAYARLNPEHEYRGVLLDRVIIGQRLGQIYAEPTCRDVFADKVDAYLTVLTASLGDPEMTEAYLTSPSGMLKSGFLQASKLRAAPALGAGVAAVQALKTESADG